MEIKFSDEIQNRIEKISEMANLSTEELVTNLVDKGSLEYCRKDGKFEPKEAKLYFNHPNGKTEYEGKCFVLYPEKVMDFDCYRIYHDGKLQLVHANRIKFLPEKSKSNGLMSSFRNLFSKNNTNETKIKDDASTER